MLRVDAHVHVFAKASAEFPREADGKLPPEREETAEKLLGEMTANGVAQAVLVQIGGSRPEQHAYLLHCLKTYPDRFLGIGLVPEDAPSAAAHMDRLAEGGVIGFRLFGLGGPEDPAEPADIQALRTFSIWKHAAEKDYVLWLYVVAEEARFLPPLMAAFPQVRAVFNHLMICPAKGAFTQDAVGRPFIETPMPPVTHEVTLGLHRYENVCVHLSGQYAFSREPYPYRNLTGWHSRLLETFGAGRLMWATDFPWIVGDPGYGALTRILEELLPDLTDEERVKIMGGTAGRFLRFPAPPG